MEGRADRRGVGLDDGFAAADIPVHAFTLHAETDTFNERVRSDTAEAGALDWRLAHRPTYERALHEWMREATTVIDTTRLTPQDAADRITATLRT